MAEPKQKTSKSKLNMCQSLHNRNLAVLVDCNNYGELKLPKHVFNPCVQCDNREIIEAMEV